MEGRQHPLRSARLAIYQRIEGNSGPVFFAKIEPFSAHPIYFHGQTVGAVEDQARAWCAEQADKHEDQWRKAQERKGKAKAAKETAP